MTKRFGTTMVSFENYVQAQPGTAGPRMVPATFVTPESVDHIRKFWNVPDIQIGMWLLLFPNGKGVPMTDSNFKAKYVKGHTTVEE